MRLTPHSAVRPDDPVVVHSHLVRCGTCAGTEVYRLARTIGAEWVELQLCRRCHADSHLVEAIDRLTEDALAE